VQQGCFASLVFLASLASLASLVSLASLASLAFLVSLAFLAFLVFLVSLVCLASLVFLVSLVLKKNQKIFPYPLTNQFAVATLIKAPERWRLNRRKVNSLKA